MCNFKCKGCVPLVALLICLMAVEALCSPGQCEPLAAAAPPQPQPQLLIEEVRWVVRDAAFFFLS